VLVDGNGEVFGLLGARDGAVFLVRPDGYIAFRSAGYDLGAASDYLTQRFSLPSA
jgi:hypothetical protein